MDSLLAYYSPVDVAVIRYHGDVPWEFDPFYNANPTEIDARYDFYSVTSIPAMFIDGESKSRTCFVHPLKEAIDERLELPTPIKLVAADSLAGDSCFVSVKVICEQDPSADTLMLRAAVIEDSIPYEAPNGQEIFNFIFRDFLPDPTGTGFAIAQGETLEFGFGFAVDPSWETANISTIVFVQDDTDGSIVQAASSAPPPLAWARYSASQRGVVESQGREVVFPGTLTSRGAGRDTLDIEFTSQLPLDWTADYDIVGGMQLTDAVALDSDSSCIINVEIACGLESGTGEATVTVRSRRDTAFTRSLRFFAVSGVCALIIDDDGGYDLETYYEDALDSLGIVWGRWDRTVAVPRLNDLDKTEFIIWFTGGAAPSLDIHDQDVLRSYLGGNGRLFLTGQDIGWGLADPNSNEYTEASGEFYETYLHAEHIMSNSNLWELDGRQGDPISGGISLTIEGGDGADNQLYPDVIDSIAPAHVIFDYSDPAKHGGIRFDSDSSKVVYLSFGFEGISTAEDRVLLLSRVVDWFGGLSGVDVETPDPLIACYPNPATSYVTVRATQCGSDGIVEIYDVLGRVVKTAAIGESRGFTWDLMDGYGVKVAPGVYFLSVSADRRVATKKLLLVR